jgi:superfamily II DNA or RNA helicase
MKQEFAGWKPVARGLREYAAQQLALGASSAGPAHLNEGQCASLRAIAERIVENGLIIADEVGMGKTRIAATLAQCVVEAGGRVAILVPSGLGFQWQSELHASKLEVPSVLRGLPSFNRAWAPSEDAEGPSPWFEEPVLLVSHSFSNWRLGAGSARSSLLPELVARWRKRNEKPFPAGYDADRALDNPWGGRAAVSIVAAIPRDPSHAAHVFLDDVNGAFTWRVLCDAEEYTRQGRLRPALERAVGLGLGCFDLVVIDEAHKGRQLDSGLSTVLNQVLMCAPHVRKVGLTATPVELDVEQWWNTLARIGVAEEQLGFGQQDENNPIRRYAASVQRLRQAWSSSQVARDEYKAAASAFEQALSPFLLRRDKREDRAVQRFAAHTGLPFDRYRRLDEVVVDPAKLDPAWQRAICAAESLSILAGQSDDIERRRKRLRLTIGNGHGISSLIDQHKEVADRLQREHESASGEHRDVEDSAAQVSDAGAKRRARARWWSGAIARAFAGSDEEPLFDHPAILAAVESIEGSTRQGEKVLVFGRFTRPLQALAGLLNAREMLRRTREERPWPQSKVHGDVAKNTGEWPAVRAAYRQLYRRELDEHDARRIDESLAAQYRRLERQRQRFREELVARLEHEFDAPGMQRTIPGLGRGAAIVAAFRRTVELSPDQDDVAIVARAMTGLLSTEPGAEPVPAGALAQAFLDLVRSATTRDQFDGDAEAENDEQARAESLWATVMDRLREEYTRPEGGFARLMNGNTKPESRRMIQLAFNRKNSFPHVLVAQSVVGREGLNLHEACRTVVLLHPEWNPGVVEQQIGRVDRVGSHWSTMLESSIRAGAAPEHCPFIEVRAVIFAGTYDAENWRVLRERWDDLRAQLHGVPVPARLAGSDATLQAIADELGRHAPDFSPNSTRRRGTNNGT